MKILALALALGLTTGPVLATAQELELVTDEQILLTR